MFDVELFARLLNVYGMERTIQMSYEYPVSKWVDIDGSKVKPIFFLKAPFELLKIVRHYKLCCASLGIPKNSGSFIIG